MSAATHDRVLPDVVDDADRIEASGLGGFHYLDQRCAQPPGATLPVGCRNVQAQLHLDMSDSAPEQRKLQPTTANSVPLRFNLFPRGLT